VLEGLDQIDWHQLQHAYGEADDVPGWLRDLLVPHEERAYAPLDLLSISLCHQGTVYSATAHTVPFLLELLKSEEIQGREAILLLLASIAKGDAYHRQHLDFYPEARRQDPEFQRELAEQIEWVERTREAARQGLPIYLELLSHPDPKIRMAAAYTLASFKGEASSIVPMLLPRLEREDDVLARASMILSLGILGSHTHEVLALLKALLHTSHKEQTEQELIHLATATALAWIGQEKTPQQAVEILVHVLTSPRSDSLFDLYVQLPWVDGSLARFAGRTLRWRLPRERLRFAISRLMEALEIVDNYDVGEVIKILLYIVFGRQAFPEPRTVHDLNEEQREVLSVIARSYAAWHTPPGVYSMMGTYSAPGSEGDASAMMVINDDVQALGLPGVQSELLRFLEQ